MRWCINGANLTVLLVRTAVDYTKDGDGGEKVAFFRRFSALKFMVCLWFHSFNQVRGLEVR